MPSFLYSFAAAALGVLALLYGPSPSSAQFVKGVQPLCGPDGSPSTKYTINCTNFAPVNGIIVGMNIDLDRHDTIANFLDRMQWSVTPGAFGMFIKLSNRIIGQTPLESNPEDLDNALTLMRSRNAIFVTSVDPTEGYDNVTDEAVALFAEKMRLFNSYGIPVLIRPAHEMNAPWYSYGQQPTKYKAFYNKVYDAVKAVAPYTQFIFAPNLGNGYPWATGGDYVIQSTSSDFSLVDTNGNGQIDTGDDPYLPYYPGDSVVDWFGTSAYWKGDYPYNTNQACPTTFVSEQLTKVLGGNISTYEFAQQRNLPIIFPEMGGTYTPSHSGVTRLQTKQPFWQSVYSPSVVTTFPLLKAGLWFDYLKNEDSALRDFSVSNNTAGPEVVSAFKQDLSTYPNVVYSSNLTLSSSSNCGCFRYNSAGGALGTSTTTSSSSKSTTSTTTTTRPSETSLSLTPTLTSNTSSSGSERSSNYFGTVIIAVSVVFGMIAVFG